MHRELVPGIQTASEGRLHPQSRTQPWGKLSWIYLETPPLQFINPEGVPPRKSWAGAPPASRKGEASTGHTDTPTALEF